MDLELLAPAGSIASLHAAFVSGADAAYIGGSRFGARAYADNPSDNELIEAIDLAHRLNKKLYLTVNTLVKEREMEELVEWLRPFYEEGLDAVIVQDLGVMSRLFSVFPDLPIHASTQMAVTGVHAARLLEREGVSRVIPARELSLAEIRRLREQTGLEIECFIHGALCYSYSGLCLMSSMIGGRSGNRGRCAGICRLPFHAEESGQSMNDDGTAYPLSMRDLCTVDLLPELVEAGVTSFKIEGRMKRPAYTAGVVGIYRKYLDRILGGDRAYHVKKEDRQFLSDLYNRDGFTSGYAAERNGRNMIALENRKEREDRSQAAQAIYLQLDRDLQSREAEYSLQMPLRGKLRMSPGEPVSLALAADLCDGPLQILASGAVVQEAIRQPLCEERVRELIGRTGGTPFSFRDLQIDLSGSAFLPVREVNALRRRAFDMMEEKLREHFRRRGSVRQTARDAQHRRKENAKGGRPALWAGVETAEQFRCALLCPGIDGLCIPLHLLEGQAAESGKELLRAGKKVRIVLPAIVRGETEEELLHRLDPVVRELAAFLPVDACLAGTLEALALLRDCCADLPVIADASVYSLNADARDFLLEQGVACTTLPLEANLHELRERGCAGDEMIVYGRAPMMISAQCVKKTLDRCDGSGSVLTLTDRRGMRFPVACHCDFCYNIIYNSLPTDLSDAGKQILDLGLASWRLQFTVEKEKEMTEVLERFLCVLDGRGAVVKDMAFTRGHFRRGIE